MTDEQKKVIEFMKYFRQMHPNANTPLVPDLEVRQLRAKLIYEEAMETITALGFKVSTDGSMIPYSQPNLIEIADGLADLHYVAYCGTGAACGIDMEPIFNEVHRSNMSKMWKDDELSKGIKENPNAIVEDFGGGLARLLVDGKVIKSPSYSPANIKQELEKQINGKL